MLPPSPYFIFVDFSITDRIILDSTVAHTMFRIGLSRTLWSWILWWLRAWYSLAWLESGQSGVMLLATWSTIGENGSRKLPKLNNP